MVLNLKTLKRKALSKILSTPLKWPINWLQAWHAPKWQIDEFTGVTKPTRLLHNITRRSPRPTTPRVKIRTYILYNLYARIPVQCFILPAPRGDIFLQMCSLGSRPDNFPLVHMHYSQQGSLCCVKEAVVLDEERLIAGCPCHLNHRR